MAPLRVSLKIQNFVAVVLIFLVSPESNFSCRFRADLQLRGARQCRSNSAAGLFVPFFDPGQTQDPNCWRKGQVQGKICYVTIVYI
jgi:hypothetical protein